MHSSQRSPIWPYLLVLTGLFVLSLALPRGWRDESELVAPPSAGRQRLAARARYTSPPVAIVRPANEISAAPSDSHPTEELAISDDSPPIPPWERATTGAVSTTDPSIAIAPLAEVVAERIADLKRFGISQNLIPRSLFPQSDQTSAADLAASYWPAPTALLAQLDRLSQSPICRQWAAQVKNLSVALCAISPGDTLSAKQLVDDLKSLVEQAEMLAGAIADAGDAAQLRRVSYAVQRRLPLWEATYFGGRRAAVFANITSGEEQRRRLAQALTDADAYLNTVANSDAWRNYLLINEVSRLAENQTAFSSDDARHLAREVLSRISPRQVSDAQKQVLEDRAIKSLAEQLRPWAVDAIDIREVLTNIERYEATGLPSDAQRVATARQALKWSAVEENRQLADQLDQRYRNANVRVAVTGELLNRMVPDRPVAPGVVNDVIQGAVVRGASETTAQLAVKLIPDPSRLHLWVEAHGTVDSQTRSMSGPATFRNIGESSYVARKAILVDQKGIGLADSSTEASTDTRLIGVSTSYDRMPVVGQMARNVAVSQHEMRRGAAELEVDERVASTANQQLNAEVTRRVQHVEKQAQNEIIGPLAKMGLALDPISHETSPQRLAMRLRLAGQNQLGSHTARPQAPSDSLASVQIHESAINNFLDELQLSGHTFTLSDLYRHVADRVSNPGIEPPSDLPTDVLVTFAKQDTVRVRCENGLVRLTLAIDQLRQGSRQWHDFTVTATYEPQIDQLHARLTRKGPIEIGGETYKGQPEVALRGIFSKTLPPERSLDLIPPVISENPRLAGLVITQCAVEDGWIGLAMGPDRRIALREAAIPSSAER